MSTTPCDLLVTPCARLQGSVVGSPPSRSEGSDVSTEVPPEGVPPSAVGVTAASELAPPPVVSQPDLDLVADSDADLEAEMEVAAAAALAEVDADAAATESQAPADTAMSEPTPELAAPPVVSEPALDADSDSELEAEMEVAAAAALAEVEAEADAALAAEEAAEAAAELQTLAEGSTASGCAPFLSELAAEPAPSPTAVAVEPELAAIEPPTAQKFAESMAEPDTASAALPSQASPAQADPPVRDAIVQQAINFVAAPAVRQAAAAPGGVQKVQEYLGKQMGATAAELKVALQRAGLLPPHPILPAPDPVPRPPAAAPVPSAASDPSGTDQLAEVESAKEPVVEATPDVEPTRKTEVQVATVQEPEEAVAEPEAATAAPPPEPVPLSQPAQVPPMAQADPPVREAIVQQAINFVATPAVRQAAAAPGGVQKVQEYLGKQMGATAAELKVALQRAGLLPPHPILPVPSPVRTPVSAPAAASAGISATLARQMVVDCVKWEHTLAFEGDMLKLLHAGQCADASLVAGPPEPAGGSSGGAGLTLVPVHTAVLGAHSVKLAELLLAGRVGGAAARLRVEYGLPAVQVCTPCPARPRLLSADCGLRGAGRGALLLHGAPPLRRGRCPWRRPRRRRGGRGRAGGGGGGHCAGGGGAGAHLPQPGVRAHRTCRRRSHGHRRWPHPAQCLRRAGCRSRPRACAGRALRRMPEFPGGKVRGRRRPRRHRAAAPRLVGRLRAGAPR
jgi:hypothetical protein